MKKILSILLMYFIILSIFSNVYALELNTRLDIVDKSSEIKYLENEQGYVSKTIVNSNANTGEVTIELKLSNTKKETVTNGITEVFFVIDNSPSMEYVTENGSVRKNLIIESAKSLATSIFSQSDSVKIGIVKFSGAMTTFSANINNATVVQSLSNDKDVVFAGIQKIADSSTSSGTNIDAGLQRANNNFSEECQNKIIVLFTDGVPTCDASGTLFGKNAEKVQANTKSTIQNISDSGVYIISMMTGLDSTSDEYDEDLKVITNIFGTSEKPTTGKFYNIADADITNIVNNNILTDIIEKIQNPINTVKIVDYFPEDITENFEFSYVGNPSIGTVTEGIDEETNTITWKIDTLKGNEIATLQYTLKIKDMKNTKLLNKTMATNEKVVLTYTDIKSENYIVDLTSSPKIKLSEVNEEISGEITDNTTNSENKDNTLANGMLPQAGVKTVISFMVMFVVVGVFTLSKYKQFKDV